MFCEQTHQQLVWWWSDTRPCGQLGPPRCPLCLQFILFKSKNKTTRVLFRGASEARSEKGSFPEIETIHPLLSTSSCSQPAPLCSVTLNLPPLRLCLPCLCPPAGNSSQDPVPFAHSLRLISRRTFSSRKYYLTVMCTLPPRGTGHPHVGPRAQAVCYWSSHPVTFSVSVPLPCKLPKGRSCL